MPDKKEQIRDALKDALRELEELESEYDWYSAGALGERLEAALSALESL